MASTAVTATLCSRPTRIIPLLLVLAFVYFVFFSGTPTRDHVRIFSENPPSQQYLAYHGQSNRPPAQHFDSSPKLQSLKQRPVLDSAGCPSLPGIEDVYVILKTGASEATKKLPIHFSTTLKCIPDFVIYSDYDEHIDGHHVHDSLDEVNRLITSQNREFDLYRRLKKEGKPTIKSAERGRDSAGWKLDKWKFLPIIEKVWRDRPMAPWYAFIEDDTYISWPNLLYYMSKLNPSDPHYVGAQMQIDQTIFAHGGSGFFMSNEAMRRAVQKRRGNLEYYDGYTASHWAGDCVLGALMDDIGCGVHWAWPNFQGQTPATLGSNTAGYEGDIWCSAAITYHHMSPNEIEQMWRFERQLEKQPHKDPMTHLTVLRDLVLPEIKKLAPQAADWDNNSEGSQTALASMTTNPHGSTDEPGHCRALCERDGACLQWRVADGTCTTGRAVMLGKPVESGVSGVVSGWMMDRVVNAVDAASSCDAKISKWALPQAKGPSAAKADAL